MPNETNLKKSERGTNHEYVCTVAGVDISSLIWKDNIYVTLISTFAGTNPLTKDIIEMKRNKYKQIVRM